MLKLSERKIQFSEDYIDHTLYILESEAKFSSCLWKTFFHKTHHCTLEFKRFTMAPESFKYFHFNSL